MKLTRTYLFIAISSVALVMVLIIQVNWIFETAKIKEDLFNEKARMVLARTTEVLSSDREISQQLETGVGKNETRKIDSLLNYFMNYYNFHVDYTFKVIRTVPFHVDHSFDVMRSTPIVFINEHDDLSNSNQVQQACYDKSLDKMASKNGWELKLKFPEREQFIVAEMRIPFITSVILILVVLILFWRTVLSLTAEKKIAEHTTDFLNNMTHEFKTPLTNIALAGKMIVKDVTLKQEDKIKHYSGIILDENEKLKLQVEQVLSMTALERGEIPVQKTEFDFHQLIKDALKSISIQIENKQGSLQLNLGAQHFMVMGDKTHLTNAICNLVDNAIKYSNVKPELTIETSNMDQNLVIVISDKGIGIAKEFQKKVFEKYFRVPTGDIHNVKGFGLGLAYIKKIVEMHGGTIALISEEGNGTTFTIIVPHA
jgi:two-component system phosphate regulon sensor histidine kinase PhoR